MEKYFSTCIVRLPILFVQVNIGDCYMLCHICRLQLGQGAIPAATTRPRPGVTVKTASSKGLDLGQQGEINGVPTLEFDLDSHSEQPWRKPGM